MGLRGDPRTGGETSLSPATPAHARGATPGDGGPWRPAAPEPSGPLLGASTAGDYLAAFGAVAAASGLVWLIDERWQRFTTSPFVLAVAFAAIVGGIGPGLLATAVSALVLVFGFGGANGVVALLDLEGVLRLALFFVVGLVLSLVGDRLHRASARIRGQEAALAAAKVQLAATEADFRAVQEASPDGFQLCEGVRDANGRVVDFRYRYANAAGLRLVGRAATQLVGRRMLEVFPGLEGDELFEAFIRVAETGEPYQQELVYTGGALNGGFRVTVVRVGGGIALTFSDVTARLQAESALAEREAEFRAMADSIPQLAWIAEPSGAIVWFNRRWYEFTGTEPGQMGGWSWRSVHHPEHVDGVVARMRAAFTAGEPWEDTYQLRRGDGEYRWFLSRALPIHDDAGRIVRWFGTNTDVTEQRQAEKDREFLLELSATLASADVWRDVDTIARVALARLTNHLGACAAGWLEIDRQGGTFTRRAAYGAGAPAPPLGTFRLEQWAGATLASALQGRDVLVVNDMAADPRTAGAEAETQLSSQLRSLIAVPLVRGGEWAAALSVYRCGPHEWSETEVTLVRHVAERVWPGIEAARAFEAERELRARTERMQRLTAALSTAPTAADVGSATLHAGMLGVGAPRGTVLLLTDGGRSFELLASAGYDAAALERWRRFPNEGRMPVADAVATRGPVIIGRVDEYRARYPALAAWADATGFHGSANFPLVAGDDAARPIGVICFDFDRDRELAADEVHYLETLAGLCAQAMDRALVYAAERRARVEAEGARTSAEEARREAERANRAKSDFLAVMSHELRTPLNAIAGHVQLVEMGLHGPVTDAQTEALGRVARAQRHLLGLINDVLNYARLESGRVEYTLREVHVSETVREVLPMVEPMFGAKNIALRVRLPDDQAGARAALVWADAEKLSQILLNLLSNAAKFTDPGGIVTVAVVSPDDGATSSSAVLLSVTDTGAGIPADKLETVFQPFVQLNRVLSSTHEGTGLGLAISRDLARGMGGNLIVESTVGVGSTFTVALRRTTFASGEPTDRRTRVQHREGAERRADGRR